MRRTLACAAAAVLTAAVAVALPAAPAAAADTGDFTALAYNVAGLPEVLSSASTDRKSSSVEIGKRLSPYDIVHVEEDFNYHAYLYAGDTTHPYRTPTSGRVPFGSGLNTLSKYAYDDGDFERVK